MDRPGTGTLRGAFSVGPALTLWYLRGMPVAPTFPVLPDPSNTDPVNAWQAALIAQNVVGPMSQKFERFTELLCRIVGDPPSADVPEELRSKGVLHEMREERISFQEEQRGWKQQQDARDALHEKQNALVLTNQADIITRVAKLEKDKHKVRRAVVVFLRWFKRWLTTKDDGLTLAIGKVLVVLSLLGTSAVASYHGIVFIVKQVARFAHYIVTR